MATLLTIELDNASVKQRVYGQLCKVVSARANENLHVPT